MRNNKHILENDLNAYFDTKKYQNIIEIHNTLII